MKTLLVKSILPVAAFMLASAGAISTTSSETGSSTVSVPGFRRIAPTNCVFVKMCNNNGELICTDAIGTPLFGKLTPASDCTEILTHRPPGQ